MSVDINNNFKPKYVALKGKNTVIKDLIKLAKNSSDILLATDEDREGEMIAWSLSHILDIKDAKRITFNSITEQEILNAVGNPREIDMNLVDAQKSRRILDRIVGYEISPLLWKSIGQSLSAGRVQSVVVRIILEKEKEINKFLTEEIKSDFKFKAEFYKNIIAQLYQTTKNKDQDNTYTETETESESDDEDNEKISGKIIKGYKTNILTEKLARDIMKKIVESEFKITGKGDRIQIKNPSPPFTTSTLQQEASRKLGFAIKRTMMAAQHLYEAGHITYMRTDSVNLSKEAILSIGKHIKKTYGNNYHNEKNYTSKSKNTQEAHECVRPTHIEISGLNESGKIGSDESKLYNLIWKRAIASQMSPAKLNVSMTQISITKLKDYYFQSDITNIVFDGFLKVYNLQNLEETETEKISAVIPTLNETLKLTKLNSYQDYKKPPSRYNEASLVNKLDPKNLNIGRPSTYAAIITKIQERGYVEKRDNEGIKKNCLKLEWDYNNKKIEEKVDEIFIGKDSGKLCPTAIGKIVTEFLVNYFPELMDYKFTSNMEINLDSIAEGKLNIINLLKDFYFKDFHPIIEKLNQEKIKYVDKDQRNLGKNEDGYDVIATIRRYGPVVMIENNGKTVNIAPLKVPNTIENITLENALQILSYPKSLGLIDKKEVKLYKGKYGFYAKVDDKNINLTGYGEEDITLKVIQEKLTEKKSKNLWEGKDGKINYVILEGPYGKYINIKDGSKKINKPLNIKLPTETEIKDLTLEKVKEIVEEGQINKFKRGKKKD
jgi:DNA topoisomerase-1